MMYCMFVYSTSQLVQPLEENKDLYLNISTNFNEFFGTE